MFSSLKGLKKAGVTGLVFGAAFMLAACGGKAVGSIEKEQTEAAGQEIDGNVPQNTEGIASEDAASEGEDLVIPVEDITEKASFYPVEIDGIDMEVIAVKAQDGSIRTAFNTCQICYDSGRGYYVQEGDTLVCQNCGNRFSMDLVEIEAGGCNPWPIFEENKTVTEESITISYSFFQESEQIFSNWKRSY